MNNSQHNPKFGKLKKMLNQMPGSILKKAFLYGLPVLSAILVIAVVATSILIKPNQADANLENNQREYSQVKIEPLERVEISEFVEKDLVQVKRDSNPLTLQELVEGGTGVELKEEDTISIVEIHASAKATEVETIESEVAETTKPEFTKPQQQVVNDVAVEKSVDSDTEQNSEASEQIEEAEVSDKAEVSDIEEPEVPEYEETWVNKYVNTSVLLNIRETPSFDAAVIGTLERGDMVTEISTNYEWSEILLSEGKVGYVYNQFLTLDYVAPAAEPVPEVTVNQSDFEALSGTMYIGVGAANLRSEANTSSDINCTLYYGAPVYLQGYADGWYSVSDDSGSSGYVREDLLRSDPVPQEEIDALRASAEIPAETTTQTEAPAATEAPVATEEPAPAEEPAPTEEPVPTETPVPTEAPAPSEPVAPGGSGGVAAAQIAASKVGLPYVYGTAGPYSFDCSGLVQFAVYQAGGSISRSAASQASAGIAVPFSYGDYSALAPGDVLCFAFNGGGVSHSGMYIGGGQFVHAMNPNDGIQINSLSGYWASSLAYVRRVFY